MLNLCIFQKSQHHNEWTTLKNHLPALFFLPYLHKLTLYTDQILIEYSVADNNNSGFPVKKIIKPIRKSVHQDSIPRSLSKKRTSRERDKILLTGYWPP